MAIEIKEFVGAGNIQTVNEHITSKKPVKKTIKKKASKPKKPANKNAD